MDILGNGLQMNLLVSIFLRIFPNFSKLNFTFLEF